MSAPVMEPLSGETSLLAKVQMIIESLSGGRGRLTLSQISQRSGLAKSTAHRLVSELVQLGFVDRADNTYQLGTRLVWLGTLVPEREDLRRLAIPAMVQIFQQTSQSVVLAVRGLHEVIYLEKLFTPHMLMAIQRISSNVPLHASASGKVLLAYAPTSVQEEHLSRMERSPGGFRTSPLDLRRELAQIRRVSHAISREGVIPAHGAIAVPVIGWDGHAAAALSIAGPMSALQTGMSDLLLSTARQLGRRISAHLAPA